MSDLGQKILASFKEFGEALDSGKPTKEALSTSSWYATEIACQGCGDGSVYRRDRTEPDGLFETTFVCRDCNAAFWVETGE